MRPVHSFSGFLVVAFVALSVPVIDGLALAGSGLRASASNARPNHSGSVANASGEVVARTSDSHRDVLDAFRTALETTKWVGTVVLAVVALLMSYLAFVTLSRSRRAEDKATEASGAASLARDLARHAGESVRTVEDKISVLRAQATVLEHDLAAAQRSAQIASEATSAASEEARRQLAKLREESEGLRHLVRIFSKGDLQFLATLGMINRYHGYLAEGANATMRQQAEWALMEKTRSESPLVRRNAVLALSGIVGPSRDIVELFGRTLTEEKDLVVRKLVKEALDRWSRADPIREGAVRRG